MRCIDKAIGCEAFGSESESSATSGVFSRRSAIVTGPNAGPPSAPACRVVSRLVGKVGARATKRPLLPNASSVQRSEAHTSELQSLMRISEAVFSLKKKNNKGD